MRRAIYLLAALPALMSQPAFATLVRVDFAGSVASITGYDASGAQISEAAAEAVLGGSLGSRFSGYVVYDTTALESDGYGEALDPRPGYPPIASWALYLFAGQSYSTIGNFTTSGGLTMDVFDNELYLQDANPSEVEFEAAGFLMYANGPSAGAPLHSTSLVGIPWSIGSFPNTTITWSSLHDSVTGVTLFPVGTIDYLVSEPAALGMVALAAYMLRAMRRVVPL